MTFWKLKDDPVPHRPKYELDDKASNKRVGKGPEERVGKGPVDKLVDSAKAAR